MDILSCNKIYVLLLALLTFLCKTNGQIFVDRQLVPARGSTAQQLSRPNVVSDTVNRVVQRNDIPRTRTSDINHDAQSNLIVPKRKGTNDAQPNLIVPKRIGTTSQAIAPTSPTRLRSTTRRRMISRPAGISPTAQARLRSRNIARSLNRIQAVAPTSQTRLRTTPRGRINNRIVQTRSRQPTRLRNGCPVLRCPETDSDWCIVPSYYRLRNGRICRGCGANRCGGRSFEDRWKLGFGGFG